MRRPLLLLLLGAAACRSQPKDEVDPETGIVHERVVLTPPKPERSDKPKKPPEWYDDQIRKAEELRREDRIREAIELVYAAKKQSPTEADDRKLDAVLRRLNQDVLKLPTLEGRVEPLNDPIAIGDPVRIRIVLRNAGDRPVRIPVRVEKASRSLFVLDVVRQDFDVQAQVVTTRRRVHHELGRDLVVRPGGTAERVVTLAGTGNDRPLNGIRAFQIGGVLRASVVEVGGMRRWEAVRLEPGYIRAFRANYQHLAEKPVARIGEAIDKRAPVHLLTASALVPMNRRRDAVDTLVDRLRGNRAIDWAIFAALQYLTDVELGHDANAWRAWWPRVRETYFADRPRRAPKKSPVFGDGR